MGITQKKEVISIIGASGFIGGSLYGYLTAAIGHKYEICGTFFSNAGRNGLQQLDITKPEAVKRYLLSHTPEYIILAAGTKNVRLCEENYDYAVALNTEPINILVRIIEKHKLTAKLIFFSTDYVFDGEKGRYKESDTPDPQTNYGKSKYLAESVLQKSKINYKIIRSAAIMGKGSLFFDWLINKIKNNEEVNVFNNVFFSPTPVRLLNEAVLNLLLEYGKIRDNILHIVGEKRLNRHEFALLLSGFLGGNKARIMPESPDLSATLFQKDLSLVQSTFVKAGQKKSFEDYINLEVVND